MDRKTFLKKTAGALLLAAPAYALISCSSSSDDSGSNNNNNNNGGGGGYGGDCLTNGTSSNISNNHGHNLTVSKTDVSNATQKTYDIDGSAGHSHSVTVTAGNFTTLQGNQQISVSSTTGDGHSHSVTISCA